MIPDWVFFALAIHCMNAYVWDPKRSKHKEVFAGLFDYRAKQNLTLFKGQ